MTPFLSQLIPQEIVHLEDRHVRLIENAVHASKTKTDTEQLRIAFSGQIAFRLYMGMNDEEVTQTGIVTLKKGSTKWTALVKTWPRDKPGLQLSIAGKTACTVIGAIARIDAERFRAHGFIMQSDFDRRAEDVGKRGAVKFRAVDADALSPPHALYLMFNGPRRG